MRNIQSHIDSLAMSMDHEIWSQLKSGTIHTQFGRPFCILLYESLFFPMHQQLVD
jgi:hypothetical protein